MQDIDSVHSNVQSASQETLLYVFEDNEAVIKMIMKGRSPTMRHVSRTHEVILAVCIAAMAKRAQQESGEESVTAKSRLMMNLNERTPSFVSSSASSNPWMTSYGYQKS